jgi:hypothetical protein
MPTPTFPLARLAAFRTEMHACFTRRADALFDLGYALLARQSDRRHRRQVSGSSIGAS